MPIAPELAESFTADYAGMTDQQLALKYNAPRSTIWTWARAAGLPRRSVVKGVSAEVTLPELPNVTDPENIDHLLDTVISLQEAQENLSDRLTEVEISIATSLPIALLFWGDWHIGGVGTDHRGFKAVAADAASTPGLYVIGMGDYVDNLAIAPFQGAAQEEVLKPEWQHRVACRYAEKLKDKALAWVRGCHDMWSYRNGSSDFVSDLARLSSAVNLWHGGILTLRLGAATYTVFAKHKYIFNSRLNTTNSQRRQVEEQGPADIVAQAHFHFAEVQHSRKVGREWIALRSGTHKVTDEHAQQIGNWRGVQVFPMVILWPDSKKMIPFRDYRDGLPYLASLRSKA